MRLVIDTNIIVSALLSRDSRAFQVLWCLNYLDYQKDIKKILSETKEKLIVIDNADILLDNDTRKYISLDDKNQYLIIGRNPKNLFTTRENLYELVSKKTGEQTELTIHLYL